MKKNYVKWEQLGEDKKGVTIRNGENFNFKCCDCGLVHGVVIYTSRLSKRTLLGLAVRRDDRITGAVRRGMEKRKEGLFEAGFKKKITKSARLERQPRVQILE